VLYPCGKGDLNVRVSDHPIYYPVSLQEKVLSTASAELQLQIIQVNCKRIETKLYLGLLQNLGDTKMQPITT
jgi:hypothetical protein